MFSGADVFLGYLSLRRSYRLNYVVKNFDSVLLALDLFKNFDSVVLALDLFNLLATFL